MELPTEESRHGEFHRGIPSQPRYHVYFYGICNRLIHIRRKNNISVFIHDPLFYFEYTGLSFPKCLGRFIQFLAQLANWSMWSTASLYGRRRGRKTVVRIQCWGLPIILATHSDLLISGTQITHCITLYRCLLRRSQFVWITAYKTVLGIEIGTISKHFIMHWGSVVVPDFYFPFFAFT